MAPTASRRAKNSQFGQSLCKPISALLRVNSVNTSTHDQRRLRIDATRAKAASFDTFYREEYPGMVAVARALVPDKGRAEDLVQESFISAHKHWARVGSYDQPRLWVRRVLINKSTSLRRRLGSEWRAVARLEAEPSQSGLTDLSLPTQEVWREVRKLPRRQQQAVALHYVSDLSIAEVAETLSCSPGTVKAHLHRARQQLKTTLSSWEDETS